MGYPEQSPSSRLSRWTSNRPVKLLLVNEPSTHTFQMLSIIHKAGASDPIGKRKAAVKVQCLRQSKKRPLYVAMGPQYAGEARVSAGVTRIEFDSLPSQRITQLANFGVRTCKVHVTIEPVHLAQRLIGWR
jgi:hypothetical protein